MAVQALRDLQKSGVSAFLAGGSTVPHLVSANTVIAAGASMVVSRYVEISAGVTLEIGADADLEIT